MKNNKTMWITGMFLLAAALVNAGSFNPETYWGYVYIEGSLVPAGTILTLESTGTGEIFATQTLPYDAAYPGSYSILLNFDDDYTPEDEGAGIDEMLTWKINGIEASSPAPGTDTAETGKTNNNFRIDAIATPSITMTIQHIQNTIILGDELYITATLNNTGAGSGNAALQNITGEIISDLPKTVYVQRNSTNQTTITVTPTACGSHTSTLTADYYNLAAELAGTTTTQFSYNVTGADLVLTNVAVSDTNPTEGDSISITAVVNNTGTANITGFTIRFYYGSTLIDTLTSTETLDSGETIGVSANWEAVIGSHTINITISTTEDECNNNNNNALTTVEVQAAETQQSGSSGGGGGSSSSETEGISILTDCNDTIDNDGDGLVDMEDPGCESPNDEDETDEIKQGQTEKINQTLQEETEQAQEDRKRSGGFIPSITGFVTKINESKTNWWLALLVLILGSALTYKLLSGVKRQPPQKPQTYQQPQQRIKIDVYPRKESNNNTNAQKQEKQAIPQQRKPEDKPAQIQKSIKISSKKEIIDKIKEVYEENG